MRIYTKTGDNGTTGTYKGCRINKDTPLMEAIGTVDELSSLLGVTISVSSSFYSSRDPVRGGRIEKSDGDSSRLTSFARTINEIQKDLFGIGAVLAGNNKESGIMNYELRIKDFEKQIDNMWEKLPPLKNFILPGGTNLGANLFLVRAVCRRAERRVVSLKEFPEIVKYLNRLSDYLFVSGRYVNFLAKEKEIVWTK